MREKYVRIIGHSKEMEFPFGKIGPWREFADQIESGGLVIADVAYRGRVEYLIAHSHSKRAIREANTNRIKLQNRILVIWEPNVVNEKIRSDRVTRNYGHVFAPSDIWEMNVEITRFKWPQSLTNFMEVDLHSWINRENLPAMIQSNKYSIHKNEKYTLRRQVLFTLEKSGKTAALYGNDWNKGLIFNFRSWLSSARHVKLRNWRFRTFKTQINNYIDYRGAVENKLFAIAQHRCAVVIENSLDYVSEKLFDAISAGSYVFYVGPKLSDIGLGNLAVQQLSPEASEIATAITRFLEMPPKKQFELMIAQRESLDEYFEDYDNSKVLRKLAMDCLTKFNLL
jgi:hypothetical protein